MVARCFDIYLIALDPAEGTEIKRTRPWLFISPDEMNNHIDTVIVAPMTTKEQDNPTRVSCTFRKRSGQIVLDQIRMVDKRRFLKRLGTVTAATRSKMLDALAELFAP